MRYRVRTQEGELDYESLGQLEQACVQGLVEPEDEVLEEGQGTWRKVASIPALARVKAASPRLGERAQVVTILAVVLLGVGALVLLFGESARYRLLGLTLALLITALLSRVTLKAFRRPPPR
jgi:hypothetical protein